MAAVVACVTSVESICSPSGSVSKLDFSGSAALCSFGASEADESSAAVSLLTVTSLLSESVEVLASSDSGSSLAAPLSASDPSAG